MTATPVKVKINYNIQKLMGGLKSLTSSSIQVLLASDNIVSRDFMHKQGFVLYIIKCIIWNPEPQFSLQFVYCGPFKIIIIIQADRPENDALLAISRSAQCFSLSSIVIKIHRNKRCGLSVFPF